MCKYDYIAEMCIKSARYKDRVLFTRWERGQISTYMCVNEFMKNNQRRQTDYINAVDFKEWLNSLGYFRKDDR